MWSLYDNITYKRRNEIISCTGCSDNIYVVIGSENECVSEVAGNVILGVNDFILIKLGIENFVQMSGRTFLGLSRHCSSVPIT